MRTVVVILDSLSYESAQLGWDKIKTVWPGLEMSECVAHAPYTPSSVTSMLTGVLPFHHKYFNFPPEGVPSLGLDLYQPHKDTWWSSTNVNSSYMFPEIQEVAFSQFPDRLRGCEARGCVAYFHMWETHIPYEFDLSIGDSIAEMKEFSTIKERILYSHNGLEEALRKLEPLFDILDPDTDRLIITADHGDAFGHTDLFDSSKERWIHQRCSPQELLVPFISNIKNMPLVVQHVDLYPTICSKENRAIKYPRLGQNIHSSDYTFNESTAISTCRWMYLSAAKYIENATFMVECSGRDHMTYINIIRYDLENNTTDFYSDAIVDDLDVDFNKSLEEMTQRSLVRQGCVDEELYGSGFIESGTQPLDKEFENKLRSLGYLKEIN